jgi:hypothetical protein
LLGGGEEDCVVDFVVGHFCGFCCGLFRLATGSDDEIGVGYVGVRAVIGVGCTCSFRSFVWATFVFPVGRGSFGLRQ